MKACRRAVWAVAALAGAALAFESAAQQSWRSQYYPEDWTPGYSDGDGRFLHDFSYAGYHRGERPIPDDPPGLTLDVTQPPYNADPTGETDSTAAIQVALDVAGAMGGGIVYLPAGTYRVTPRSGRNAALRIAHSGVVLRGGGPEATFLFNDSARMRGTAIIRVQPAEGGGWYSPLPRTTKSLAREATAPARHVFVEDTRGVSAGDWLVLTHDVTEAFVAAHAEHLVEDWADRLPGVAFYRQVVAVDPDTGRIDIDIPLRYDLKTRDDARLYRVAPHIEEVGIEDLAIGNREHPGDEFGFEDYRDEGTAAYDVHSSYAVVLRHVVNGWVRRVHTYRPEVNEGPHHLVSNGLVLRYCRGITVRACDFRHAQYRGGGGNGYGFVLRGNDCLVQDCYGTELRYAYDFKSMYANGNVIHRSVADGATSDFHMHLSVSNLMDNLELLDGAHFNARERPYTSTPHGITTDQSVFWRPYGTGEKDYLINVRGQSGNSKIIGSHGERTHIRGLEEAHDGVYNEGEGRGASLVPASLYEDQLLRRLDAGE